MFVALRTFALTTSLLVGSRTIPPPSAADTTSLWSVIEHLVFVMPLSEFINEADSPFHDERLNWTSDGCSAPVIRSTGRSFDFTSSCRRHDFAYRNIRAIDRGILWTSPLRHRVDNMFLRDMKGQCSLRKMYDRPSCTAWALIFFHSVRLYAGP